MRSAWRVFDRGGAKPANQVAALAARQRGIVTNAELRECGLTYRQIARWVRDGHLHEKHRGVYAVGHRTLTEAARFLAAVKACGPAAVLSHYAAAALWDLLDYDGRPPEVTTTTNRKHPGITVHRT